MRPIMVEIRLCAKMSVCLTPFHPLLLQLLAVLFWAAVGRNQDKCGASLPQIRLDGVTAQLAVLRREIAK